MTIIEEMGAVIRERDELKRLVEAQAVVSVESEREVQTLRRAIVGGNVIIFTGEVIVYEKDGFEVDDGLSDLPFTVTCLPVDMPSVGSFVRVVGELAVEKSVSYPSTILHIKPFEVRVIGSMFEGEATVDTAGVTAEMFHANLFGGGKRYQRLEGKDKIEGEDNG